MYSSYSKWIDKEIEIAKELGKPIIAIEPWGSEKTSTIVKNSADSIVTAIREKSVCAKFAHTGENNKIYKNKIHKERSD